MRTILTSWLLLSSLLGACAQPKEEAAAPTEAPPAAEAPPPAEVPAGAPPTFASAAPRMGGAVVATGDYSVELVANAAGTVDAAVTTTATGEAVSSADVAELEVTVQGEGETRLPIALSWDAPRGMFHGAAKAGARVASGPGEVSCKIRGKAHASRLDMLVALPRPKLGGRMLALGRYSAEVVPRLGGDVDVHLQDAKGAAVTADAGLALAARAHTKAAAMQALAFRWDAPRSCFTAKLEGDAQLAPGPFELTAKAGAEADLAGRVEAIALIPEPKLGGSMIAAGDFTVEVAPQLDGNVDAIVYDSAGASVDAAVDLEAHVQAGGELRPIKLVWDPALMRFRGKLEGKLKLEPGPIELAVNAQGKLRTGAIMAAAVMPKLKLDAKLDAKADAKADLAAKTAAKLDAKAKAKADVPDVKGKANAALDAKAKLSANVPKPSVSAKAGATGDAKASGSAAANSSGEAAAKASAKGQGGVKLGGSLSIGTK